MRLPKIIASLNPTNLAISIDFVEKVDLNFAIHMENFLYDLGHKYHGFPATNDTNNIVAYRINSELARLISIGSLKLDSMGVWCMAHIEDISNIGTDAVYKRQLNG
jgi:hypothetical protein